MIKPIAVFLILVFVQVASGFAVMNIPAEKIFEGDVITLKGGGDVTGVIVKESKSSLTLDVEGGLLTIQKNELIRITRGHGNGRFILPIRNKVAKSLGLVYFRGIWILPSAKKAALRQEYKQVFDGMQKKVNPKQSLKTYKSKPQTDIFGRDIEKLKRDRAREERTKQKKKKEWHKKYKAEVQ